LIQQFKLHEGEVFFTSKKNQPCARNLQLAYVTPVMEMPDYQSFLIEKPHSFYSGEFFCGFVSFGPNFFQRVGELRKSDRGEIELSDMINGQQTRTHAPIDLYTHSWADLTYDSDVQNIRRAISEWKFGG
jgi:dTDP-glucose pyrophosphorylase